MAAPISRSVEFSTHPPVQHQFSLSTQDDVASPASLASLRNPKPITLVVYTFKEGENVPRQYKTGRFTTAEQVQQQVMTELAIPQENSKVFSIWLTSRHLQLQLKHYHLPCKIFKRWKDLLSQYTNARPDEVAADEPVLFLRRNAFYPLKEERTLLDPKKDSRTSIDRLYHEAVFNVTRGQYPFSVDDFHTLAGLQASVYAAEHDIKADTASLTPFASRFYPRHMLTGGDPMKSISRIFRQKSQGGQSLYNHFTRTLESAQRKSTDPHQLKVLYLQLCWSKPYYGSVLFYGQIERPFNFVHYIRYTDKKVIVAINTECVHIFSRKTPSEILLFLTYDQLSWEFEPAPDGGEEFYSALWLEFDSVWFVEGAERKVAKRLQIFSRQAPMMDAMITRCVNDINKQEEGLRRLRLAQGGAEALPDVSIVTHRAGESPKTQRQDKNYQENKLKCSMWTEDGECVSTSGFTLSRVLLKRSKSREKQYMTQSPSSDQALEQLRGEREQSAAASSADSQEILTKL